MSYWLLVVGVAIGLAIASVLNVARKADREAQQTWCRQHCPYYDPEAMG